MKRQLVKKIEDCVIGELKHPIADMLLTAFNPKSINDLKIIPFKKRGVFEKTIILIEHRNKKYILKETEKFNLREKACEILAMKLASDINASPFLKAADFKNSIVLLQYIQHDFSGLENIKPATIISIADILKSIHRLDITKYQALFPHKNKFLPFLLNEIQTLTLDYPHLHFYRKIIHIINFIEEILTPYKSDLCHYDLHPWNLLFCKKNEKVFFIDWESVGIGDGLYDIATISAYLRFNHQQENMLLQQYYGDNLSKQIEWRFLLNKIQATLFYSLGFIFVNTKHGPYINFSDENHLVPFQYFEKPISNLFLLDLTPVENYQMSYRMIKSAFMLLNSPEYENAVRDVISKNLNRYPRYNQIYQVALLPFQEREILYKLQKNIRQIKTNEDIRALSFYVLMHLFVNNYQKNISSFLILCRLVQTLLKNECNVKMDIKIGKDCFNLKINKRFLFFKETNYENNKKNQQTVSSKKMKKLAF
ncbi:MAG TPA: aminoglycoside phosphotransferase family protein [Gammaproteobacteria bacterium]|nr:aminoglycoside phosphotransferase family protein [Gammaproteobacteria bacterium]